MNRLLLGIMLILSVLNLQSQIVTELNVPVVRYPISTGPGSAQWITNPDINLNEYNVVLFRKELKLKEKPEQFIIHITADNRYKLFINEKLVCIGPQLSDMRHWRYETIDISSYLNIGKNIVAAEVVNWGKDKFFGIISTETAFLLQGNSQKESIINSNDTTWKTSVNKAYSPEPVNWMYGVDVIGGFYASNPGERIDDSKYPLGWTTLDFNDHDWNKPVWAGSTSLAEQGGMLWLLMPRSVPLVEYKETRFSKIARITGMQAGDDFLKGSKPLIIPENAVVSILIDNAVLSIGFPRIELSGGKDASIKITYAENLFNEKQEKENRNKVDGMHIIGVHDIILPSGVQNKIFTPLWYHAFRYIQLDVHTGVDPLIINDYYNMAVAAPLVRKAEFKCDDPEYSKIMDICWRTASICVQDNLMSDAYYETMQYVGDSRVHTNVLHYLTGDTLFWKNAITQFNYSRLPDGMITSCFPLRATFIHPTFSLIWVDMIYDYMMQCGNKSFILPFINPIRATLDWFANNINENGLVGKPVGSYFVDWYEKEGDNGSLKSSFNGNSAVVTLHYVYTLQNAAAIFKYMGKNTEADEYLKEADQLKKNVYEKCYDVKRGLFAENPGKQYFDSRANIMAVLTDAIPVDQQKELLRKAITDTSLSEAGYYYRFNFFNALHKVHAGDYFDWVLKPWKGLTDEGLTTTPEKLYNPRSEAHPWSTAPAYAYFKVICGIEPAEPGFNKVIIAPDFGKLNYIEAVFPHQLGNIIIKLTKKNNDVLEGEITLPRALTGKFLWKGKEVQLKEGLQKISL